MPISRSAVRTLTHRTLVLFILELQELKSSRWCRGYEIAWIFGGSLILSGVAHLAALWWLGASWEGPVSWRKPGLFGVSAGVTVFSLIWVVLQVKPLRIDPLFVSCMAAALWAEVALITVQFWRGVPSHFNRATSVDATIETVMFGLILLVTLGVGWLCLRAVRLPAMALPQAIALRWGLAGLLVSCLLGLFSTVLGDINLAHHRPPEKWGQSGVLKFPHGAVLHAIQSLPVLAAFLSWQRIPHAALMMRLFVAAHVLFLAFAIRQTVLGRERWDCDWEAAILLVLVIGCLVIPAVVCSVVFGRRVVRQV